MMAIQGQIDSYAWWASLKHGGLLIAPSRLTEFFLPEVEPLPRYIEDRLRRDVSRVRNSESDHINTLLDTVLEDVLQLSKDWWIKGSAVDRGWSQQAITRETIKPRRVWQDPHGGVLPVFVADTSSEHGRGTPRLGMGRERRSVSRVIEWLRKANQKIALLTNGRQWRLIHAGSDYDAWCEWDVDLWFEEGQPGLQVQALRLLLGEKSLHPEKPDTSSPLIAAIQASRQGQAELSDVLGERVRLAVELLIRELSEAIAPLELAVNPVSRRDIYIAATRTIMRCVVILFAEARDLLPRNNPIYYGSYGIQGLREQLDRMAGGRAGERLRNGYSAWPRLLALFRLVYEGCAHEALPIPRYGGGLFAPGNSDAKDSILRALSAFEHSTHMPSDAIVHRILELLCRSKVKVRQGRSSILVEAPVDFSDLSSEYIGILYEGLLDFELRRASADDPMVFLNLGDQPALPLARLEGMDDAALANLVEKLKQKTKTSGGEDSEEDEAVEVEAEAEESDEEIEVETPVEALVELEGDVDQIQQLRARTHQWAVRAVEAGKLVAKPKRKSEALAAYQQNVNKTADNLIVRIVLPGEWFLVRWGGTRKGSGTFYTRPQLAIPTTRRTLQPLVYDMESGQESSESATPKKPEEILALKVCDPAMGSGSFLVAALRFLTAALYESLHYHQRIEAHGDYSLCRLADGVGTNSLLEETLPVVPDADDFEERLKARLKRYVVERCLYGVDIDPLAVELARLSLWVETMDRALPFGFLDHKLKCGNSLVGCWFDRFQDYPAMAWEREGGDKNHDRFVHHFREYVAKTGKKKGQTQQSGDKWTQAIKDTKNDVVKPELKDLISRLDPQLRLPIPQFDLPQSPEQIHDEALAIFEEMHNLPVYDTEERERRYRERIEGSDTIRRLKLAFDTWCAVWFWSGECIDIAPTPGRFFDPPPETKVIIEHLAGQYQFFHWELEFPDVFASVNAGFNGVIGNPPWEVQKPNSKEFFSNVDPLYRTYGKQEALNKQLEYFEHDGLIERSWLAYCDKLKSLSNWNKYAALPFGDEVEGGDKFNFERSKGENERLHELWRRQRKTRQGYAEPRHPFQYQGSADVNTYKMFVELGYTLLKNDGRFSLIVPSGIYSDKGTSGLRNLFLSRCQWTYLYAFQNERFVFSGIDHRNKMVIFTVTKGGSTSAILTRFRLGPGDSPEAHELESDIMTSELYLSVPATQITKFSPKTGALLEIRTERDLAILEKMYAHSVLLGDDSPQGWGIHYATEFHMTNDSKLFPPRPQWEKKGYQPDEYGHWLKGNWQPYGGCRSIIQRSEGLILSAGGSSAVHVDEIEDIALPLYQGIMVGQLESNRARWVSGSGNQAVWKKDLPPGSHYGPQFLISRESVLSNCSNALRARYLMRNIARTTDTRTMIGSPTPGFPAGHSLAALTVEVGHPLLVWELSILLSSFVFDWCLRQRLGGTNLSWIFLEEMPTSNRKKMTSNVLFIAMRLSAVGLTFSRQWQNLKLIKPDITNHLWKSLWSITPYECLRLHAVLDAIVADLYGLDLDEFVWILRDSDYSIEQVNNNIFARNFDPKGFWRVDKEKDPELRHTVLSLVAFYELKRIGLEAFLNLNDGEGWMLPETLRLADYGLGHDDRAKEPQPVASRLGDRFLPWQLEGTPEESWEECERHAKNLNRLLGDRASASTEQTNLQNAFSHPTDLFGNLLQLDLFGNLVEEEPRRKSK